MAPPEQMPLPPEDFWSFDPALQWQVLDAAQLADFFKTVWPEHDATALPPDSALYAAELPFYTQHKLYCLRGTVEGSYRHCFVLHGVQTTQVLNGNSNPIHEVNAQDPINITQDNAACYLRFFCSFVYGDFGPFLPIEDASLVNIPANLEANLRQHAQRCEINLMAVIAPIQLIEQSASGYMFAATILYSNAVFFCKLRVNNQGGVEMLEDSLLVNDIPEGMLPLAPKAYPINDLLVEGTSLPSSAIASLANSTPTVKKPSKAGSSTQASSLPLQENKAVEKPKFSSDRDITRCYISVLIKHALENAPNYNVINDFNKTASRSDAVQDFANYVIKHGPVVVIESEFAYAEELIADLVSETCHYKSPTIRRIKNSDSDLKDHQASSLFVMSTDDQFGYGGPNFERLAFEISMSKHPVIIGTNHAASLHDAIQKVVEFKICLPKLNADLFRIVFTKILGGNLPRSWKKNTQWFSYLTPHDFHQPCKAGLSGAKALQYLQARVNERLKRVESANGPTLQNLHGMAEAKQIAEDLISDIQSALAGQLPWSAVDRGMLLAGPPGTGKTTLARAIAKACGVRFIAVSAATWQSAGAMSEHLRAMRASFAEARRYAPSILFIDEMDSFSNREHHVGNNATYNTEIVNALLAEIQGFDTQQPVFVIGATNFPHKVDPALRRAGRLDKLVYIPHPNVEALTSIYDYYLSNQELVGQKADDIDTKFLGGISFGVTGADVESFVRGAVRRARKDQKPLNQQHLIDEITGKSRTLASSRLNAEEMHRVAVHEAGHALLQTLTGHQQLAYVSIVPRENGSLGFVANMPTAQNMRTRKQYLENLQVLLAGRAAEEIVFGKDNISGGAGGDSQHSDLAVATRLATNLVCNLGMGKTSALIWGNIPSEDQQEEIEKLLQEAYSTALAKLEAHRKSLDAVSKALVEKQELIGEDVELTIDFSAN